jgi:hypothetical protein
MTTAAGASSDMSTLLKEARKNGYKTVPGGGGHKKLVDRYGKTVTDANGPLILSSSPSDARWREMTVKRWMAAGVLKSDPFDSTPLTKGARGVGNKGKGRNRIADPDVQAAKIAAIHAKSERDKAATLKLRETWEPIMVKLGGWDKYGVLAQTGEAIFWFGEHRGHVERFPSASAAKQALSQVKKGNTLSEKSRIAITYFSDEITKDPTKVQERYFELVRLSKGLPAREDDPIRGGEPLSDPPPKEEREKQKPQVNGSTPGGRPATKPSLALEVVAQMMVGRSEVDDRVLKLGEEIQEMELRDRGLVA